MIKDEKKIAIYPLSGDPFTAGHFDIVNRADKLFISRDIHVVIANNRDKKHFLSIDERLAIAKASLGKLNDKVKLVSYDGIISEYAKEHNADVMVRGIRDGLDFSYEVQLEQFTRGTSDLETVYLSPYTEHLNTSSSLVRMFIQSGNILKAKEYMVPEGFETMLELIERRQDRKEVGNGAS